MLYKEHIQKNIQNGITNLKSFAFNGWCIGGPKEVSRFYVCYSINAYKNESLRKDHVKYIHLLGISKISDFFILATLQKLVNQLTNNRVLFSTDSSSPGQYPVFGTYLAFWKL